VNEGWVESAVPNWSYPAAVKASDWFSLRLEVAGETEMVVSVWLTATETLLVVDEVTGENGFGQARQFLKVAGVTGIVLTKLDGTAKGGIAVAIAKELNLPIRYAGIGEKVDDLVVFDPHQYVNSLFGN
jgi:signal recognition particle GTPase